MYNGESVHARGAQPGSARPRHGRGAGRSCRGARRSGDRHGVQPADRRERSDSSRRDRRHPGRRQAHRQLPAPRGDALCDDRAVSDVRGSNDPRQDRARRLRHDGTEGRGDRISDAGARASVAESPDGSGRRPARSRMPRGDSGLFQVAPRRIELSCAQRPAAPKLGSGRNERRREGLCPERCNKRLRPQARAGLPAEALTGSRARLRQGYGGATFA